MPRKITLVVCLVALFFALPAYAILGLGDIVFDPSNYAQAVQQLLRLEQQYAQLVKTYQTVTGQYEHMLRMARQVPVNMSARYRALATPWTQSQASNTYGSTARWMQSINRGANAIAGYTAAIEQLESYGSAFGKIPPGQTSRIKTGYATVELTDGANVAAIETIGQLRENATNVEAAIRNLENDSLSNDPAMNTEVALLNKINAANIVALRNTQDTNKLLVALAESEIITAKRMRDAEARSINHHVRFMTEGKALLMPEGVDASQAMRSWRMP